MFHAVQGGRVECLGLQNPDVVKNFRERQWILASQGQVGGQPTLAQGHDMCWTHLNVRVSGTSSSPSWIVRYCSLGTTWRS